MKKVLLVLGIIIGVIILLVIAVMAAMAIVVNSNNAYKGDKQQLLKGTNGKKALVVYQPSISSASSALGENLAKGLNEAGYEVTVSYPGKHLSGDVSGYDLIVIGSTVFAAQPSKMITEYLPTIEGIQGKKLVIYSMGGMDAAPELDAMEANIKDATGAIKHKFLASKDTKAAGYEFGLSIGKE